MSATIERSDSLLWQRAGIALGDQERARLEQATALLDAFLREVASHQGYPWDIKPDQYESGKAVLAAEPDTQAAVVIAAVARLTSGVEARSEMPHVYEIRALLPALLRRRLPYRE